ncbi:hypothetical protein AX16_006244 [Volvariella volvacea WC 439]|nr:hypothetical protein AX16_006244 [Volvariella volvacea WC 439]
MSNCNQSAGTSSTNQTAGPNINTSNCNQNGNGVQPSTSSAHTSSSPPTRNPALHDLKRHPKYYICTGDIHFLAGNVLFKVHSYFFERESQLFRERINAMAPSTPGMRGPDDVSDLVLDVSPECFAKFLDIFYNPNYTIYVFTVHDWADILDQAYRWGFDRVKDLAIRELEKIECPTVDRLALYEKYGANPEIAVPLYVSLVLRIETISIEESMLLGIRATVFIFHAREKLYAILAKKGLKEPPVPFPEEASLYNLIRQFLGLAKSDEKKRSGTTA